MNDKTVDLINRILYYVVAPVLVLEFILSDIGLLKFTGLIFVVSLTILFVLIAIVVVYKRKHPDYDFRANDLYTKILFVIILMECFYTAGFFNW